jgi:ubiquinone/menaquinone biosynthesis C-methylase UbiE
VTSASDTYFDGLGERWDALRAGFFSPAVRERAFAVADLRAGQTAADVGAGTGFLTEGLLARGLRVVAVDPSQAMLDALAAKLPAGAPVERRLGWAEALPLPDGTLDHVFANMCLHHVETPPEAVAEMARVLRPGGTLVLTDLDAHEHEFLAREHCDRWLGFERDDVRAWLEEAGLEDVRIDCVGEDCRATSEAGEDAAIGIFVAWGRRA